MYSVIVGCSPHTGQFGSRRRATSVNVAPSASKSMAALTEQGIPVVLTGVALPESSVHSPNEKLPVEYLTKARDAARELYLAFADLPRSG